ncbi:hypothetical protein N431DRAFT_136771 [Stipitochalara longipes BDJ]|nr:hypothetical protein N431DRAFT_136771 [Stipitochalara longipes BDJ]
MACETCRLKKIKCDKVRPKCGRCDLRHLSCHYVRERRRPRKLDASEIEKRLHQMEAVFRHMNERFPGANVETRLDEPDDISEVIEISHVAPLSDALSAEYLPDNDQIGREDDEMGFDWSFDGSSRTPAAANSSPAPMSAADATGMPTLVTSSGDQFSKDEDLLDQILSGKPESPPVENNAAVWIRTEDGDEYTGPSSGISLLSHPGLTWIQNTFSGTEGVCNTLKSVALEVANHLQIPKCIPVKPWASIHIHGPRKPLPPEEVVWTYVDAYFRSVQCLFPVLDRHSFESRLRTYFQDPKDTDTAWTALMVAVLASGCRALLSAETPTAFEQSGAESWAYFQTAIDLVSQLLYKPANLPVVEALLVMTVYAQGLSSPQRLEYTFCALAAQVAQGLGLHRKPLQSWNLSDFETQERNRLFWVIYVLDKTISLRCGRPSLIDDKEISCSFPYSTPILQTNTIPSICPGDQIAEQTPPGFDFFFIYTQYARICGNIAKLLYSASALSRPFSGLLPTARKLESAIDKWRDGIPDDFRPGRPFRPSEMPKDLPQIQALSLSFGYHYMICSVHRRFSAMFERPEIKETTPGALRLADSKYLEAARSMILLTKHLDIESHTPGWMLFYYPITALLGVFTSVVCNPKSGSGNSDIALMEVIVGHLGRLEFMTSGGTAFNKIGELVRLARVILRRACEDDHTAHDRSPSIRQDSATERLNNKRSMHENSADVITKPRNGKSRPL